MSYISPLIWVWIESHQPLTAGILTFIAVLVGLLLTRRQLVLTKTTEQAKLITNMSQYWDSQIMHDARKAIREIPKDKNLKDELLECMEKDFEKWLELTRVGNFFEEMGNLAHGKALDLPVVAGRFRTHIRGYCEDYELFIREKRKTQPTVYQYFEWLRNEIEKIQI